MSCAGAFDSIYEAAVGCRAIDNGPEGMKCMINTALENIGEGNVYTCLDVTEVSDSTNPASYSLTEPVKRTADLAANTRACQIIGALEGKVDGTGNMWKADGATCALVAANAEDCTKVDAGAEGDELFNEIANLTDEFCSLITYTDTGSIKKCMKDSNGSKCAVDSTLKCSEVTNEYTVLETAGSRCPDHWTLPDSDLECLVNNDLSVNAVGCKEYSSSDLTQRAADQAKIPETAALDAGYCLTLGNALGDDANKAWVPDSAQCKVATECGDIDWNSISDWSTIGTEPLPSECVNYTDANGACKAASDASNKCEVNLDVSECAEKTDNATLSAALTDCPLIVVGDGTIKCNVSPVFSAGYVKDAVACKEYVDEAAVESMIDDVQTPNLNGITEVNNVICMMTALKTEPGTNGIYPAYVGDLSKGCTEASSCDEVKWLAADLSFTGYTTEELAAECKNLKVTDGTQCTADGVTGCTAAVSCASTVIGNNTSLVDAKTVCEGGLPDDAQPTKECRLNYDLTVKPYSCALVEKAAASLVEVKVDASFNKTQCALMGSWYGGAEGDAAPQNAWTVSADSDDKCAVVDICSEVDFKTTDAGVIGTFDSDALCKSVGHTGYYDEGETLAIEGQVTCKKHATEETCDSSLAIMTGAIMAGIMMIF